MADIERGGGLNEGVTPQFHPSPAYLSPRVRYRTPFIRFDEAYPDIPPGQQARAFIGTTLARVVQYVWGGPKINRIES